MLRETNRIEKVSSNENEFLHGPSEQRNMSASAAPRASNKLLDTFSAVQFMALTHS